jgi:hypothetical protein
MAVTRWSGPERDAVSTERSGPGAASKPLWHEEQPFASNSFAPVRGFHSTSVDQRFEDRFSSHRRTPISRRIAETAAAIHSARKRNERRLVSDRVPETLFSTQVSASGEEHTACHTAAAGAFSRPRGALPHETKTHQWIVRT